MSCVRRRACVRRRVRLCLSRAGMRVTVQSPNRHSRASRPGEEAWPGPEAASVTHGHAARRVSCRKAASTTLRCERLRRPIGRSHALPDSSTTDRLTEPARITITLMRHPVMHGAGHSGPARHIALFSHVYIIARLAIRARDALNSRNRSRPQFIGGVGLRRSTRVSERAVDGWHAEATQSWGIWLPASTLLTVSCDRADSAGPNVLLLGRCAFTFSNDHGRDLRALARFPGGQRSHQAFATG